VTASKFSVRRLTVEQQRELDRALILIAGIA
jgi:hypothetical protein